MNGLMGLGLQGSPGAGGIGLDARRESGAARGSDIDQALTKLDAKTRDKIVTTANEFESVFLAQMMEYGFEGVSSDPMSGEEGGEQGGFANDTYRSMLLQEYGKSMTRAGGIGIADHVKRTMLNLQETGHGLRS